MNNEAIAVKCSLHGPQIVRERQSSSHTRIFAVHGKGVCVTSHVKLMTNARCPVSVNLIFRFGVRINEDPDNRGLDNRGCTVI